MEDARHILNGPTRGDRRRAPMLFCDRRASRLSRPAGESVAAAPSRPMALDVWEQLKAIVDRETALASVGHAIQLSVAPVFLMLAIGAMLGMLTSRLTRVVDRARAVEAASARLRPEDLTARHRELATLSRRAKLINRAITLCTLTALFVCGVIAALFLGAFLRFDASIAVAALFLVAMAAFIAGALFFLREIFIATGVVTRATVAAGGGRGH